MEKEADGVTMMKPIAGLDDLLKRAVKLGIYGTKMRSTINLANPKGIAAIAKQQYEVGAQISAHGLVPILEPEVLIKSPEKAKAEAILLEELLKGADALPAGQQVMVKVTIPDVPDLYAPLIAHKGIQRVVALSGGYTRDDACARLAKNHNMIASFSRALVDGLNVNMSDAEFNAALGKAIDEIYTASTVKS
jgi:fructose-bisphosphate aldolase class I